MKETSKILTPLIGLEIHLQLKTNSKLFCSCANNYNSVVNKNICQICTGQPGSMPSLNKNAVEYAVMLGVATNSTINNISAFDRKNYFYPDLPKGFQITQNRIPICENGKINITGKKEKTQTVLIKQIHIEEDSAKIIHTENESLIDYNRSGIPLLEIVTEPCFNSADEVYEFLKEIKLMIKYLGISDCQMENGSLRVDVNISLLNKSTKINYPRNEIKNLNSFTNVRDAINFELKRQSKIIQENNLPESKTLLWNEVNKITKPMRNKISSEEYKFIPEPDIPSLQLTDDLIENIKSSIPELPAEKRKRFRDEFRISSEKIEILIKEKLFAELFESVINCDIDNNFISNFFVTSLREWRNNNPEKDLNGFDKIKLYDTIKLFKNGKVRKSDLNLLIEGIYNSTNSAKEVAKDLKLILDNDSDELDEVINSVLDNNKILIEKYRSGKKSIIGFFIGEIYKELKVKCDPQILTKKLKTKLDA